MLIYIRVSLILCKGYVIDVTSLQSYDFFPLSPNFFFSFIPQPSSLILHPSAFSYQKSLVSSYTSYTSITNPLYIGLCVVRDGWEMCRIGALFNKILTLFCTTICFLFTLLHSLTEQSRRCNLCQGRVWRCNQGGARGGSSTHWNILFHPMEQLIPPIETTGEVYCTAFQSVSLSWY